MQEMNRQVRYDEYVAIIRRSVLNLAESPVGRLMLSQNKEISIPTFATDKQYYNTFDKDAPYKNLEEFLASETFEA